MQVQEDDIISNLFGLALLVDGLLEEKYNKGLFRCDYTTMSSFSAVEFSTEFFKLVTVEEVFLTCHFKI